MKLLVAWFRLVRWPNLLMLALVLGVLQAKFFGWPWPPGFWWLAGAVLATAAAGYLVNDVYDQATDAINRPARRVVGVHVRPLLAKWATGLAAILALSLAVAHSKWLLGWVLATLLALWAYAAWLKRTPGFGNLLVAALSAAPVALLAHSSLPWLAPPRLLFTFVGFAFGSSLVRELIKTLEDQPGDRAAGCRTLPICWGEIPTKNLIYSLLLAFGLAVLWAVPPHLGGAQAAFGLVIGGFLLLLARGLRRAQEPAHYHRLSQWAKLMMLAGLLGVLGL
ncbi:MAG: UbiA family prenyltransferase [Bernardetiaceae bacterium]|nr:UbiA family prenyltransferase [Bernardetiaceae bacterium]